MRRLIAFLGLVLLATACGLPSDHAPRQIADDKVPFELLGPSTTTPTSDVAGGPNVRLYFLEGSSEPIRLRAVNRGVPSRDPQTVLVELVKGLIDTDPFGIITAIPKDTQIISVAEDNEGQTIVVTLNNAILNIQGSEQKNAFGQMVYTVTDLGPRAIRFRVTDAAGGNAQDVPVPTDSGAKAEPLTRADFTSLQPRS